MAINPYTGEVIAGPTETDYEQNPLYSQPTPEEMALYSMALLGVPPYLVDRPSDIGDPGYFSASNPQSFLPPPVPMKDRDLAMLRDQPSALDAYMNDFSAQGAAQQSNNAGIGSAILSPPASGFNPAAFSHPGAPAYNPTAFTPKEPPPEGGLLAQGQSRLEDINKQREADRKNLTNWGDAGGGAYVPPQVRYGGSGGEKVSEVKSSSYTALPADVKKGFKDSIQGIREASRRQQEAQDEMGAANEKAARDSAEAMLWEQWRGKVATHDHEQAMKQINGAMNDQQRKMNEAVEAVRNSKVNKNRFMDEMGAGGKTLMGVGLLLSSLAKIGSIGRVGQKRPENRMLEFSMEQINQAIDRDIRAQQMEHDQKKDKAALEGNFYSQLRQRGVDQEVAFDLARSRGLKEMRLGLERIATNLQSEASRSNAELLKAKTAEAEQKTLFDAYAKRGQLEGVRINKQKTTAPGGGGGYEGVPKNLQLPEKVRDRLTNAYQNAEAIKGLLAVYKEAAGSGNFLKFWQELPGERKNYIRDQLNILGTQAASAAGAAPLSDKDREAFTNAQGKIYSRPENIKKYLLSNLARSAAMIKGMQKANPDKDLSPTMEIQQDLRRAYDEVASDKFGR